MRKLILNKQMMLRVEMYNTDDDLSFIEYDTFHINPESDGYKLSLGPKVYGDLVEYFGDYHNDLKFSTYDSDNDKDDNVNCAQVNNGGWWFKNCFFVCLTCKDTARGQWLQSYITSANYNNIKMMIKPKPSPCC